MPVAVDHEEKGVYKVVLIVALTLCVLSVLTFSLLKYFRKANSCCYCCFWKKPIKKETRNESFKKSVQKLPNFRNSTRLPQKAYSHESLNLHVDNFEIPGKIQIHSVQPDNSSTSDYFSVLSASEDDDVSKRITFLEEPIQPKLYAKVHKSNSLRSSSSNISSESFQDQLNLDIYASERRYTQGAGSLGKIKLSLQYEDISKQTLSITFNELLNLTHLGENIIGICFETILLPDRQVAYQSKVIEQANFQNINQTFHFLSKPQNRDFEARTVYIAVKLVEKSQKEIAYGETRISLLNYEIYNQVSTDLSVGIKSCSAQNEIGDIQLCMSYHPDQKKLVAMAKTIKFMNSATIHNITSIHIKARLVKVDGVKLGKKRVISKYLLSNKADQLIEFQDSMSFKLSLEHFSQCTLKLNLHGKHKILGKHINLGKVRIGENNKNETGKVHWWTLTKSDAIGWNMWHPIYSS
ncbi:synaptotagmin-2 isoform X2 [Hydra vulgaris]